MPRSIDIAGVGAIQFPDEMTDDEIVSAIENDIIPNHDNANPDPELVSARPDLFPDIDRGSFFGGLGSGVERLGRAPEAVGAAIGRSQEELDSLKSQMSEDEYNQRYRASLDDVTDQFGRGEYLQSAGTLFTDVLPQTLGESIPDMGIIGSGAVAGALAAAPIPIPGARIAGAIAGGAVAGLPTFFGMNVERQIQENNITDPDEIETLKAASAAALQGSLEGLILPALNLIPGVKRMASREVSELVMGGVEKLTAKGMAGRVSKFAAIGGGTEAATEFGQQMLERAQAGLDVTDPAALKEYVEAAVLGGLLGVGFGGVGGGVSVLRTKKDLANTYDIIEQKNAEQAQRLAGQERDLAEYVGAIPARDAPLRIEARPELQLEPINGDIETSGTETVQRRVNATEGEFNDRNEQRLIDEAMDPEQTGYNEAQRETLNDVKIANEALQDERFTSEDLTANDEVGEMVAPALAQALTDRQAGQGDVTTEQNSYTIEELEALAKQGEVTGQNPEIVAEELQKLRRSRRPTTELYNSITEQDVTALAEQKNIKTGTNSFNALVKYITGADTLAEASPFRLIRMRETLNAIPDGAFEGQPKDLINKREQSFTHGEFNEAVKRVLNNNKSSKGNIGEPRYTQALMKEVFPSKSSQEIEDVRDEMVRIGLIRPNAKKKGSYLVDNRLMREEFIPANESVPDAKPIAAMDNKQDFTVEERTVAATDEEGNLRRDENGRPVREIGYHVIAKPKKPSALDTGAEEVISVHNNLAEAQENAKRYAKAPSKVTRRMRNPETGRDKNMSVPTTSADLRGMAADPAMYAAEVRERTKNGPVSSASVTRIREALEQVNERRGLQKLGIPINVVNSVRTALGAKSAAPEGTEGAYVNQMIYVGLDVAVDKVPQDTPAHLIDSVVLQNLLDVLSHEQIHALKDVGVLNDSDMSILTRMATSKTRPEGFRMFGEGQTEWTYFDDVKASQPNLSKIELEEEAVAELFRDWTKDPSIATGKPASLFRRIVKFFTTLGGFFKENGARNVSDIFGEIDTGTLKNKGPRPVAEPSAEVKMSVAEYIVGPAVLDPDTTEPIRGLTHFHALEALNKRYNISEDDFYQLHEDMSEASLNGFVTNTGRYVSRIEAETIAKAADQIKHPDGGKGAGLLTEDLYDLEDAEWITAPPEKPKFSVAPPINSAAFKKWFGDSKMVDANGDPLVVYHGTSSDIEEFDGGPATYMFKSNNRINYFTPNPSFAGRFASMRRGVAKEADTFPNVMPVYLSLQKLWDFRNPDDLAAAEDFFVDLSIKMDEPGNAAIGGRRDESFIADFGDDIDGVLDGLGRGEFRIVENGRFVDEFLLGNKYQGFTVVEGKYYPTVRQARGAGYETVEDQVNYGVFEAERIKSVLNQGTFDSTNPNIRFSVATKAMSDTQLHDEVKKVEAAFNREVSPEVQAYHDEVMQEDTNRHTQAAEQDVAPITPVDPDSAPPRIDQPYMRQYGVKVYRQIKGEFKKPLIRYFVAANDIEARNLVASSPAINKDAFRVDEPYIDDPNWDEEKQAPKFSVRRWGRVLDNYEYQIATRIVPDRASVSDRTVDENVRGMAWLDSGEPLPVVLLQGVDQNGAGFGREHIVAKAARFGTVREMGVKLRGMLEKSYIKGSKDHRVKRYIAKDPAERSNLDYQMTWKDPSDGTVYVLGLEKYTQDRVKYAAIVTFYPMDRKDGKNAGDVASENDIQEYMRMQEAQRPPPRTVPRFSVAPGQQLLQADPASLGLSPAMAARVNPIYRPGAIPAARMKDGNQDAARWLETAFEGEAVTDMTAELSPEQIEEIATLMAAEVQLGFAGSSNAFDWYSGALDRALDVVKVKYPMIADDAAAAEAGFGTAANARFVFTYIMAVTSQNLAVDANAIATDKAFGDMVKRVKAGKFYMLESYGTGDKQKAMAKNFKKFGVTLDRMPGETFPEKLAQLDMTFRRSMTVKDWVTEFKSLGIPYTTPGQTAMDAVVYGSSILGPKIGNGFWQNLNQNFDPLTIDLWMRRTWGRLTGKSIGNPSALPEQRDRFKRAIVRSRSRKQGVEDHVEAARSYVRLLEKELERFKTIPVTEFATKKAFTEETKRLAAELVEAKEIAADLQGIKIPEVWKPEYNNNDKALLDYAKRALSVWTKEYHRLVSVSNSEEIPAELQPTWARAAKTIVTNLAKPLDQVANGTQRRQIEAAGARTLEILAERGVRMTMADMQAMLWYPEKELWGALRLKLDVNEAGVPVIPESSLNESYDTAFTRILGRQNNEVQGVARDRSGGTGAGAITGQDARSRRSESAIGVDPTSAEVDGRGQNETPLTKFSVAGPINTDNFRNWFKNPSKQALNEDGSGDPKVLYFGATTDFEVLAMKHTTEATFVSESSDFVEDFIGGYDEYGVEFDPITDKPKIDSEGNIVPLQDRPRIFPVFMSPKKIFDFRDPEHIELAKQHFKRSIKDVFNILTGGETERSIKLEKFKKGAWSVIENPNFINMIRENGFDGFAIVERPSKPISNMNPVNYGLFNRDDIKSVFNEEYDRSDPKFSVTNLNSFEQGVQDRLTEKDKTIWNKANKYRKRWLSPGGLLPEGVLDIKVERDGMFRVGDDIVMRSLKSFETAVKKVYGKHYLFLTPQQKKNIDALLHGDESVNVAPAIRGAVFKMRQDIDAMSDSYVKILKTQIRELREQAQGSRALDEEYKAKGSDLAAARAEALEKTIVDNKGTYVSRSYKAFTDPNWSNKIPPEVTVAALNYLATQYDGDYNVAEVKLNELVKGDKTAYMNMEGLIKESTLGARDLTILMGRKNIAPEIRALLGENTDADVNYARTMLKMNRLIHNTRFLGVLKEKGDGNFLFEEGDPRRPPEATAQLAGNSSKVMEPLNGMFTTPEVKQALEDALGKSSLPQYLNNIIGINGAIKYGKVVLSLATQIRNFMSAPFFVMQSGTFDLRYMKLAMQTVTDQIRAREGGSVEYYRDLVKKGVLYDTPNAGLLQDLLDDSQQVFAAIDDFTGYSSPAKITKATIKRWNDNIKKVYRGSDDFWKIVAYEGTKAQLAQAKPNLSIQEVEAMAAKRTRDTVPTYSLTGKGMKALGRFPLVGSFVAFSSEIIRTSINNLKLIKSDLNDPELRPLAYKRMVGMAVAHAWASAAASMTAALYGVDDDEEEAMRKLGSPWAENSAIAYLGRDDNGEMRTIDLSFVDPYNIFHKPLVSLMRDQPWEDSLAGAVNEVWKPFFGLDIAAGSIFELVSNSKLRSGAPIFNPDAPAIDQTVDIAGHLISTLAPGIVSSGVRIGKAVVGTKTSQGRVYKLEDELAGAFGVRLSTFNPKFAMYYRVRDFKEQLSNANSYLYEAASNINPVDDDALASAFKSANDIRIRGYSDMMQIVNAARKAGLSSPQIRRILTVSNLSKKYSNALARGKEAPKWRLGTTFLKGATKRAKLLMDKETANEFRRRRRLVRQLARTLQQ